MRGCLDYPNGLHEGVLDDHADIVAGVALGALSQVLKHYIFFKFKIILIFLISKNSPCNPAP